MISGEKAEFELQAARLFGYENQTAVLNADTSHHHY